MEQKNLSAQNINLADFINYQDGAVVSRELLNKNGGTITVFAFDEGEGLSEHTVPFEVLAYIIDGEAEIKIAGVSHKLQSGEMIVMPNGKPHIVKALKKFKMLLVMIKS